jgi:hypothetical protein
LERENDEIEIECGSGSTYMITKDSQENRNQRVGYHQASDPKLKHIRDKLRKAQKKQPTLMLGSSGTIDNSHEEEIVERTTLQNAGIATTGDFLQAFSEYVIEGGSNLAGIAQDTGIDENTLRNAAILVQKSQDQLEWKSQKEINRLLDEKELEFKQKDELKETNEQKLKELCIQAATQAGQQVVLKAVKQKVRYEEDDEDEYDDDDGYLNSSGPVMVNQSYKQVKHSKELGMGNISNKSIGIRNTTVTSTTTGVTPPDHCYTCGQHKTECISIGPSYRDSKGIDQCFLRDDLQCQIDMTIINLDKLKLASLTQQQVDKVIAQAARYGCLRGASPQMLNDYKANLSKFKESIGQTISNNKPKGV